VATVFLLAGCIFSPDTGHPKGGPPPPPLYYTPSTPDTAFLNFITAYQNRDSVFYKTVYDSSYVGTSTDYSGQTAEISTFTYKTETDILSNMARSNSISSISMNLGNRSREASNDAAHPEYALIQVRGAVINFYGSPGYTAAEGPGDVLQFLFKPTSPAAASPSDTLWKIVRWTEINVP